jgi:hypothetical protein
MVGCLIEELLRGEERTRDLLQDINLFLLQLRERIQLVAKITDSIKWFATRFGCEDVGFLTKCQCLRLLYRESRLGRLTRSVVYCRYMSKASWSSSTGLHRSREIR